MAGRPHGYPGRVLPNSLVKRISTMVGNERISGHGFGVAPCVNTLQFQNILHIWPSRVKMALFLTRQRRLPLSQMCQNNQKRAVGNSPTRRSRHPRIFETKREVLNPCFQDSHHGWDAIEQESSGHARGNSLQNVYGVLVGGLCMSTNHDLAPTSS